VGVYGGVPARLLKALSKELLEKVAALYPVD